MGDEPSSKSGVGWAAWTLILGMIVAAAALGIFKFNQARHTAAKTSCDSNLRQIDAAVQQWALENKKSATDTYSFSDPAILACMKGSALPECPGGGRYLRGSQVSASPRCTIRSAGHTL